MDARLADELKVEVCWGKLHRAHVTRAELHYVGSITIDQDLMDAAGFFPNLKVKINNVNNGFSWETYVHPGERGKGDIILNGPPAHNFSRGHVVIILGYGELSYRRAREAASQLLKVVYLNEKNRICSKEECLAEVKASA